ncbi:hypothetical protein [Dokdonella sp.]|uniref:hypothetical protein n=1 Tax=Dokdonella sp. TaxID=2291710 RepID=UPI001B21E32F|nr:hypothetical protein [Dokdonella sp.]MBO9664629.1 hypothetical protein [Dokdonella sp.]
MNPTVRFQPPQWCLMATIQVAEGAPNLVDILADLSFDFRLDPAPASPPGFIWFQLFVDARRGQRRCELTAHRLLSALQRIAEGGDLPGFRVVAGERWLEYPASDAPREGASALRSAPGNERGKARARTDGHAGQESEGRPTR